MTATLAIDRLTPEEFFARPDHHQFELVDGELVEVHVSLLSSRVGMIVGRTLDVFCTANDLGLVFGADLYYGCFPGSPAKLRKPDVTFIKRERARDFDLNADVCRIVPDLAVEVVSKNDLASEVDEKIGEYLQAGFPMIWVVNPEIRTVHVYRIDGSVQRLREEDELRGDDVIPGFVCRVSDLLPESVGER
jgi:Uma2 family endonuclease